MKKLEFQKRKEEQENTYKPVTNEYNSIMVQPTSGDKCLDLYARVRKGQYAEIKDRDVNGEVQIEERKFKPLEIDPKIYRKDIMGQIKGMDQFMSKSKKAHEKQALEKLAQERNPDVILVAGAATKKNKKQVKTQKMYGPERMATGVTSKTFGSPQKQTMSAKRK